MLLTIASSAGPAAAASGHEIVFKGKAVRWTPPTQATGTTQATTATAAATSYSCWQYDDNFYKSYMYGFKYHVRWCQRNGYVVSDNWSNTGGPSAGPWIFVSFRPVHDSFGFNPVHFDDYWDFKQCYQTTCAHKYPSVSANVYANGSITGTVYYG